MSAMADRVRILTAMEDNAFTCYEMELELSMDHQTCSARFKDLKDDGLIVETGQERPTKSGRMAKVHARTDKSFDVVPRSPSLF